MAPAGVRKSWAIAWHLLGVIALQGSKHELAAQNLQRALTLNPADAEALNNLAIAHKNLAQWDDAIESLGKAVALRPDFAEAIFNLANALQVQGRLDDAIDWYSKVLQKHPHVADAHNALGRAFQLRGDLDQAVDSYRRTLELRPDFVEAQSNLGFILQKQKKLDAAILCHRKALDLQPDSAELNLRLGVAFHEQRDLQKAVFYYCQSLKLSPDNAEAYFALGNAYQEQSDLGSAVDCYRRAIALRRDFAEAHRSLGTALTAIGLLDEALACFQRAIELKADYAEAYHDAGIVFKDKGQLPEAIDCFRRVMELQPDNARAHSNLVYSLWFSPNHSLTSIYDEHRRWNERWAGPLRTSIQPHSNDRTPERALRIGYVSPNFRNHCQSLFLLPLFSTHNREMFEIVCYSDATKSDSITAQLRQNSAAWRDTSALKDEQLAAAVRDDKIDILVDLTMHMTESRLLLFARKPAPVQACWLAYPGTTGLTAIDYRLTDPYLDPIGLDDRQYSEQSIRLADTFWCYDPLASEPNVNPLPALTNGYITFGCLNNYCKVHGSVLKLWAGALKAVDRSRLMILSPDGSHRQRAIDTLKDEGISADRISFVTPRLRPDYLQLYGEIDLSLDTFPYNGHTTGLDSFWMGVPVVTLVGSTVVGRAGASQLTNLGLTELIAKTPDDYIRIAAELAGDLPRLSALRETLRERMRLSPLMDAPRFARSIEAAYRSMWQHWCAGRMSTDR